MRVVGLVLIAASLVAGTICGVKVVSAVGSPLAETLTAPTHQAPFDAFLSLNEGRYAVYERVGASSGSSGFDAPAPTTLGADQVTVIGPGGSVEVGTPSFEEEIDLGSGRFVAVASFTAPAEGEYRVRVRTRQPTVVIVAPRLGSGFGEVGGWLVGAGLSGLGLLVGMGLVVASFLRRGGPAPVPMPPAVPAAAAAPAATPPGWYPDPQAPQLLRYWDGGAWTSHTQPRG